MNAANVIFLSAVPRARRSFMPAPAADLSILDLTHDAVFLRGSDGAIEYWNRAAEKMYGWTAHEAAGRASHELLKTVFPDSIEEVEAHVARSGRWEGDLIHTCKDGTQVAVASRWSLQRDQASAPDAVVVYEVPKVYANTVAATVAHEIRQPLTAMVTSADAGLRFLDRPLPNLEKAKEAFKRIAADGHRAGALVESIRTEMRNGARNRTRVDVNELIRSAISLQDGDLRKHRVAVCAEADKHLPPMSGNPIQLQQVLLNLIANAIDAMAMNEEPRVLRLRTEARESGHVAITVADTGTGAEPGDVDRMFDPLFTTKAHGMGMGLAICRGIVEAHGGRLSYAPNTPRGAAFQFTLRCA